MSNTEIYRHYFKKDADLKRFSYNLFKPIKNWEYPWVKPHGGFWASRLGATEGWKDWCESEGMEDWYTGEWFDFYITPGANILYLKTLDDINMIFHKHPQYVMQCTESLRFLRYLDSKCKSDKGPSESTDCYDFITPMCCLNFEKLVANGVDAIDVEIDKLYYPFYGWDCDSTLIMNPDVIVNIKGDYF